MKNHIIRIKGKSTFRAVIALITTPLLVVSLSGFITLNGNQLIGGLQNRKYWLDGSVNSTLESKIYSAKWLWGNATPKISLNKTLTKSEAQILLYESSTIIEQSICGLAIPTDSNLVSVNYWTQNWSRGKILLADEVRVNGSPCVNGLGIVTHEFGHLFGLFHSDQTQSIMREDVFRVNFFGPKQDDIEGINEIYK